MQTLSKSFNKYVPSNMFLFSVREAFENMKKSFDQEIADLKSQLNGISECIFLALSFIKLSLFRISSLVLLL